MESPKGATPKYESMEVLIKAVDKMNSDTERIEALIEMCELLETQRDSFADFAKRQQTELKEAVKLLERSEDTVDAHEKMIQDLNHSNSEFYEHGLRKEAELNESNGKIYQLEYELKEIQKQRQIEKAQYLEMQKGANNQIEQMTIKFNNLVAMVRGVRNAQKAYFAKRKKFPINECKQEQNYSMKLEDELDNRLSTQPGANTLFHK